MTKLCFIAACNRVPLNESKTTYKAYLQIRGVFKQFFFFYYFFTKTYVMGTY